MSQHITIKGQTMAHDGDPVKKGQKVAMHIAGEVVGVHEDVTGKKGWQKKMIVAMSDIEVVTDGAAVNDELERLAALRPEGDQQTLEETVDAKMGVS